MTTIVHVSGWLLGAYNGDESPKVPRERLEGECEGARAHARGQ